MAQPYIGEIRMFAGNFAPAGWMFCEGQLMPISENEALFKLIGTTYGGDGRMTFALPDLRGRIPIHQGNGFSLAETGGVEAVTLTAQQIPIHTHPLLGDIDDLADRSPSPTGVLRVRADAHAIYIADNADRSNGAAEPSVAVGGSQPHDEHAAVPVHQLHHLAVRDLSRSQN